MQSHLQRLFNHNKSFQKHIDDMLIAGKHDKSLQELKYKLKSAFPMKDLGKAEHILGIKLRQDRQKVTICVPKEVY